MGCSAKVSRLSLADPPDHDPMQIQTKSGVVDKCGKELTLDGLTRAKVANSFDTYANRWMIASGAKGIS